MPEPTIIDGLKAPAAFGGSFAFVFAAMLQIAKFVTGRLDKRQAQLDAEDAALNMGWKEYRLWLEADRKRLNARVETIEIQNRALRLSFEHVAGALIRHDPQDPALLIAERLMAKAFPDDFQTLAAMAAGAIDQAGEKS